MTEWQLYLLFGLVLSIYNSTDSRQARATKRLARGWPNKVRWMDLLDSVGGVVMTLTAAYLILMGLYLWHMA